MPAKALSLQMMATAWVLFASGIVTGGEFGSIKTPLPLVEARPDRNGLVIEHPGPTPAQAVDAILRNMQRAKSTIDRFDAKFSVFIRDDLFETVQIGEGRCSTDCQGRAFYKVTGLKQSNHDPDGYVSKPLRDETWCWTERQIIRIDDQQHLYEALSLPPENQYSMSWRPQKPNRPDPPPLPEEARRKPAARTSRAWTPNASDNGSSQWRAQWHLLIEFPIPKALLVKGAHDSFIAQHDIFLMSRTDTEIRLDCKSHSKFGNYEKLYVLLDANTYELKALKFFSAAGCKTTLLLFKNVRTNSACHGVPVDLAPPKLSGYPRLIEPAGQ